MYQVGPGSSSSVRLLTSVSLAALFLTLAKSATQAQTASGTVALIGNHPVEATTRHPAAHGDCIAIVGVSDYIHSGVPTFNAQFGLPASSITTILVDGSSPGINNGEAEAMLDLEWSHAVAPGAPTRFYLGNSGDPIGHGINQAVSDGACGVISVSFGACGVPATYYTVFLHNIYVAAAAQGQSIFVSSGDDGAAGITFDPAQQACVPASSRNVNELGADPNVTQVGGTGFNPVFDGAGKNVGHVAELAWNDESGATGGGASVFFTKPRYQTGTGCPPTVGGMYLTSH
jgi:subtilase family serine protease